MLMVTFIQFGDLAVF